MEIFPFSTPVPVGIMSLRKPNASAYTGSPPYS